MTVGKTEEVVEPTTPKYKAFSEKLWQAKSSQHHKMTVGKTEEVVEPTAPKYKAFSEKLWQTKSSQPHKMTVGKTEVVEPTRKVAGVDAGEVEYVWGYVWRPANDVRAAYDERSDNGIASGFVEYRTGYCNRLKTTMALRISNSA